MTRDLRDFWRQFQTGVEVAVGGDLPDKLLGVRDGFRRYFHGGLETPVPVSVVPQPQDETAAPLPLSDAEILELAQRRARQLEATVGHQFAFCVGTEAGLLTFEAAGEARHFVRSWSVVRGLEDEAWGSSGSVQLPQRLIAGLDGNEIPFVIPGRRRSGGMVSSLTGGLETRRLATSQATLGALATLMYGLIENRGGNGSGAGRRR